MLIFQSHSAAQTRTLAGRVVKKMRGKGIITLSGPLGAGKTEFTKGAARALGVKRSISSPTFVLHKQYPFFWRKERRTLEHFDLYRLRTVRETDNVGINDALLKEKNLILIEWPQNARLAIPKSAVRIKFEYGKSPQERILILPKNYGRRQI